MAPAPTPTDVPDLLGIRLIHRVMRTDLHRLTDLAGRISAGEPCSDRRATAVAGWIAALGEEIHDHHSAEDDHAWPVIAARAGAEVDLAELSADHAALDPLLDAVRAAAAALVAATESGRAAVAAGLESALGALRDDIDEHLDAEEETIFPVIERCVPVAEWQRVEEAVRKGGPGMRFTLPRLVAVTSPDEYARVRRFAGPALLVLLAVLTPGHRHRERLVFG